jgi:hypothetical protein
MVERDKDILTIIEGLIKRGLIKTVEGLYFRENKYENSIILTANEFEKGLLKVSVVDNMKKLNIKEIELNDSFGVRMYDLNFIDQINWIEGVKIIKVEGVNSNDLKRLPNIKKFVNNYSDEQVDFQCFKKIEMADILWSKGRENILECKTLKKLTIHKLKLNNLINFKNLENLKSLTLISSSIESLEGLENLVNLEELELHFNSKLEDLSALSKCRKLKRIRLSNLPKVESLSAMENCKGIESIIVDNCKKIIDNKKLFTLSNLRIFSYSNSGGFQSIKEIENLVHLERFIISDTNIIDGDLDPLLKLKKINFCFFKDKKHYSLKLKEIKQKLAIE